MVAWEGNKFGVSVWGVQSLAAAYMRHAFPLGLHTGVGLQGDCQQQQAANAPGGYSANKAALVELVCWNALDAVSPVGCAWVKVAM